MRQLQSAPDVGVRGLFERVDVVSQRSGEEDGVLGNDGDLGPNVVQAQSRNVRAVDVDMALR
jgi:hypothetical protein